MSGVRIPCRVRVGLLPVWLAVAGTLLVPSASGAFRYLQEGMTAPIVTGNDIRTGEEVSSTPADSDAAVVVTFWATWSKRSLELLADLKEMAGTYPQGRLRIIAVNVEDPTVTPEMRKLIDKIVADLDLPYPVLIDEGLGRFYEFGVIAVPSTAILDSTGNLRYAPSGYSYTVRDRMVDTIEVLLGLKAPSAGTVARKGYVPNNKASRYYQLALQMANKRMYERALANLEPAFAADSLFSGPHNLRGHIYLLTDSAEAAAGAFAEAVRLDSTSVAAWAGWGAALLAGGRATEARVKLETALAQDDAYTPALLDLAFCLSEQGETDAALDSLRSARDLNPKDPAVHVYLARVFTAVNAADSVVNSYRAALELLYPVP